MIWRYQLAMALIVAVLILSTAFMICVVIGLLFLSALWLIFALIALALEESAVRTIRLLTPDLSTPLSLAEVAWRDVRRVARRGQG